MKKILKYSSIFIIIDFISKIIISKNLFENQSIKIMNNFFNITYAKNTGIAFSFLENSRIIIIIITLAILIALFLYLKEKILEKFELFAYSLIIGGAFGNLIDRIIYGYVIDFLDFKLFNYHYPIFNLADSFIVIGIILLLIKEHKEEL